MIIHKNFAGGNIQVVGESGDDIYLKNELRDTGEDWFYWAFCVENAENKTLTFHFEDNRLGYFGPAVSKDFYNWFWLNSVNENSFTYTFGANENKVYFAHHMLYNTERFYNLAKSNNIEIRELCKTKKGRSVPYIEFGKGKKTVLLTSRHHACESTGDYVLEGVIEYLLKTHNEQFRYIIVPFVDFDGVIDGDQGKSRIPHDHNRDYIDNPIYPETKAIMRLANSGDVIFGCDFHSPWHNGGENDNCFIVCNDDLHSAEYKKFGNILELQITSDSFSYKCENNHIFGIGWNTTNGKQFGSFINSLGAKVAFTLETAYFGTKENVFTPKRALKLGECFAKAMLEYLNNK